MRKGSKVRRHVRSRNCILVLLIGLASFPLFANPSSLLPIDLNVGQIVEGLPGSVEEKAEEALSRSYSLAWLESYIPSSMRIGFVHTYDRLLASLLPVRQLQIAKANVRGTLFEVPFCYHEPHYGYGSMTWMQNEEGAFVLLSLSVHE